MIKNKKIKKISQRLIKLDKKIIKTLGKRPILSVFIFFIVIFIFIVIGQYIRRANKQVIKTEKQAINVEVFSVGQAPKIRTWATVYKDNVLTIHAQSSGIVYQLYVSEGEKVLAGSNLMYLSTNYRGSSAQIISTNIAKQQYDLASSTYDLQKDLIAKQRQIAKTQYDNTEELREITKESKEDTQETLNDTQEALEQLNEQIKQLDDQQANSNVDDPTVENMLVELKQQQRSLKSAIRQLESSIRTLEYQSDEDAPPFRLAKQQRDLAIKQLDLQEKSLKVNLEISKLQYDLASINQSLIYPSSPFSGEVQKVHVNKFQIINPGTPLVTIKRKQLPTTQKGGNKIIKLTALVPAHIAKNIAINGQAEVMIDNQIIPTSITYVSQEATDNLSHSVLMYLSSQYDSYLINNQSVEVNLPVGNIDSLGTIPFVPLDAIYQTNQGSFIKVVNKDNVQVKQVELGEVFGSYVTVLSGLEQQEQIILTRSVVDGDKVDINFE